MAIRARNNFCIAPFTQITHNPNGHTSPCPEIGGQSWKFTDKKFINIWKSDEFQKLRNSFEENNKDSICYRCWEQEDVGKKSLRTRLFVYPHLKENIVDHLNSGDYLNGPRQINLMVGNLCNLRCRICNPESSVTLNIEGKFYKEKYGDDTYYDGKATVRFSEKQIQEMYEASENLKRLEFYGGEPLLDTSTIVLLEKLIDSGRSKNITLFYNTNGTKLPNQRQIELWNNFKSIEFNFSIDDIFKRFTYQRYPAVYEDVIKNLETMRNYNWKIPSSFYFICTISNYNIFYILDILDEFSKFKMPFFLNEVKNPGYFAINYLPKEIRDNIIHHFYQHSSFNEHKNNIEFLINILRGDGGSQWEKFKFWTKAMDDYRNESFQQVFPEFYSLILDYDKTF